LDAGLAAGLDAGLETGLDFSIKKVKIDFFYFF